MPEFFPTLDQMIFEALDPADKDKVRGWVHDMQNEHPEGPEAFDKRNSFSDHAFQAPDPDRVHRDLIQPDQESEHQPHVEKHLEQHGYKVSDYKAGKATDKYGREVNIGRILNKTKADPELMKKFESDPGRARSRAGTSGLQMSVSRHPYDVAGMTSKGHDWENESCMNFSNGGNKHYLPQDIKHGTHVAYLTKHGDDEIEHPLARIALKKYTNTEDPKDHILRPEHRVYGNAPDAFTHTLNHWVDHHFPGKDNGIYKKHDEVYDDSANRYVVGKDALPKAASHIDYRVRMAAARHPDLSHDQLTKLIHDGDVNVGWTAFQHPKVDQHHITDIVDNHPDKLGWFALDHPKLTSEHVQHIWDKGAKDDDRFLMSRAARHPKAPQSVIHEATKGPHWVASSAASNPNISKEDLQALYERAKHHMNPTEEGRKKGYLSDAGEMMENVMRNPKSTGEMAKEMYTKPDTEIHERDVTNIAARHPKLPRDVIHHALKNQLEAGHLTGIMRRPDLTPDELQMALDHNTAETSVQAFVAEHHNATPKQLLHIIKHSPNQFAAASAVHHKNADEHVIQAGLEHPGDYVNKWAIDNPKVTDKQLEHVANSGKYMPYLATSAAAHLRRRRGNNG